MIDYLKGSIVKLKLHFEKSFRKQMRISMIMPNMKKNTGVFRMRQFIHCNSCIFKISSYQNILINFDLFPKNDDGYFVAYFD